MPDTPLACTLTSADYKHRLEDLAALSQSALRYARREDLVLHLRYSPEAEQRVRRMVEKEQACCPFLSFEFMPGSDGIELRVTAPESARNAVNDIYAQFLKD